MGKPFIIRPTPTAPTVQGYEGQLPTEGLPPPAQRRDAPPDPKYIPFGPAKDDPLPARVHKP